MPLAVGFKKPSRRLSRIKGQAAATGGVLLALATRIRAALAVGVKKARRIKGQAAATGGVQLALATRIRAALAVGGKKAHRIKGLAAATGGVQLALATRIRAALAVGVKKARRIKGQVAATGGVALLPEYCSLFTLRHYFHFQSERTVVTWITFKGRGNRGFFFNHPLAMNFPGQ